MLLQKTSIDLVSNGFGFSTMKKSYNNTSVNEQRDSGVNIREFSVVLSSMKKNKQTITRKTVVENSIY